MSNTKPTMSLRDQITAHLASAGEATWSQIAKAVGMADFPSRVMKEVNAMRTDALLEAERKGKGPELTYWLAVATPQDRRPDPPSPAATNAGIAEPSRGKQERRTALQSLIKGRTLADAISTRDAAATLGCTPEGVLWILRHEEAAGRAKRLREKNGKRGSWIYDPRTIQHTQPAEVQITGSSASALTPLSEGAAVQPNPAPVQPADVSPAAPVAADDMRRTLDGVRAALIDHIGTSIALSDASEVEIAKKSSRLISSLLDSNRDHLNMIAVASETLAAVVHGSIDTSDMDLDELAKHVADALTDYRQRTEDAEREYRIGLASEEQSKAQLGELRAQLANNTALVEKLEHLLQSARNEAEHLRMHAAHADADMVNHPPHYQGKVECIDAIEAALGPEGFAAYCRGNAIKYSFRAGRKGPCAEDLAKARWYLARAMP